MSESELQAIRAFHRINPKLATAGQPEAGQFALLGEHFNTIINLARPDSPHALPDEATLAAQHGLTYIALPVDFKQPRQRDFERFCDAMQAEKDSGMLVHCALNWRVSSFVYLYRVLVEATPEKHARRDLHAVWQPDAVWTAFVEQMLSSTRT